MKRLILNRVFVIGFMIGLIVVGIVNKLTANSTQFASDCGYWYKYGFPFLQYETCDDLISVKHILWVGLFGNILFALCFSFLFGLICRFVYAKFTSVRLN